MIFTCFILAHSGRVLHEVHPSRSLDAFARAHAPPEVHALLNSPDFRERLVSFDPSCLRASPGTARRLWAAYFGPEAGYQC